MKQEFTDEQYNSNWVALLNEFKEIDHKSKDAKEKYAALKEKVKTVHPLTISPKSRYC